MRKFNLKLITKKSEMFSSTRWCLSFFDTTIISHFTNWIMYISMSAALAVWKVQPWQPLIEPFYDPFLQDLPFRTSPGLDESFLDALKRRKIPVFGYHMNRALKFSVVIQGSGPGPFIVENFLEFRTARRPTHVMARLRVRTATEIFVNFGTKIEL